MLGVLLWRIRGGAFGVIDYQQSVLIIINRLRLRLKDNGSESERNTHRPKSPAQQIPHKFFKTSPLALRSIARPWVYER